MWNLFPGSTFGVQQLDCASRFNAPLLDTPGADPSDDGGADSPSAADDNIDHRDADEGQDPPATADGDDTPEDLIVGKDDDDDDQQRSPEDRIKALTKKNRKLQRQLVKALPKLERYKDLDLDDLILRARRGDDFARALANNPKLRTMLNGGEDDSPADTKTSKTPRPAAAAADTDDDDFDESKLPFDPNENDANRYFADMARKNHELSKQVKALLGKDTARETQTAQQAAAAERSEWKSAIDAAADTLPEGVTRTLFKDAMAGAYRTRTEHGRTAKQIIDHYLKDNVSKSAAKAAGDAVNAAAKAAGTPNPKVADAAARSRIATNNNALPRTVAPGGNPAPARQSGEKLADVHKRVRNSIGR